MSRKVNSSLSPSASLKCANNFSAMNLFYVEANQQRGPVSDEQLKELARAGTVLPTTLVSREGMAQWQPYSTIQQPGEASAPRVPPPPPPLGATTVTCAECGRSFGSGDVVRIQNFWVCGACKPVFLQRMIEGAPPPAAGIWRSGKDAVAAKGAIFPDRCVKCNAPVHG